jgi:hypothetical protein
MALAPAKSRWLAYAFCCVFLAACSDDDYDGDGGGGGPVGSAPTSTQIANQTINQDSATSALAFTVADPDTNVSSLTTSGSSSNTTLVPNSNIVFGGSGANRTVTVTPAAGQSGTATITYVVSDGVYNASKNFVLTVNPSGTKTFDTPADAAALAAALSNIFDKVGESNPAGKAAKVAFPCADGGTFEQTAENDSTAFAGDGTLVFADCANSDDTGNDVTLDGQFVSECTDPNQTTSTCNDEEITFGQVNDPLSTHIVNSEQGVDVLGQFYNFLTTFQDDGNQETETVTLDGRLVISDNSTDSCGNADVTIDTIEALKIDNVSGEITAGELDLVAADGSTASVVFNADGSQTVTVDGVSDTFTVSELQAICEASP